VEANQHFAFQFADERAGHGPDALDALSALESLTNQSRQLTAKAAPELDSLGIGNLPALLDDLAQKLHVRGEGDVLLLDCGVHGYLALLGVVPVQPNRYLEDQTRPVFADSLAKIGEVGVVAREFPLEIRLAAQGLVVGIPDPGLDDALVAQVFELLEDHEPGHEPDGLGRLAMLAGKTGKILLELLPGDCRCEFEQGVSGIELVDKIPVEEIALVIPGCLGLHHHSRPGYGATGFLQNHCSFWSRMLH
jgi:hypothetical protein